MSRHGERTYRLKQYYKDNLLWKIIIESSLFFDFFFFFLPSLTFRHSLFSPFAHTQIQNTQIFATSDWNTQTQIKIPSHLQSLKTFPTTDGYLPPSLSLISVVLPLWVYCVPLFRCLRLPLEREERKRGRQTSKQGRTWGGSLAKGVGGWKNIPTSGRGLSPLSGATGAVVDVI